MIRLLAGVDPLTAGERIVGDRVAIGYFAQNLAESLDYTATVLEELGKDAQGMTTTEIRSLLGAVLFSGDDVFKRVGVLSGGERTRLALAKVLARRNNCLLLDEPTNNLDIIAKDALLEALRRFPGTVVMVSHDRFILNELVTQVIEVGHGHTVRYLGNYDDYLTKKAAEEMAAGAVQPAAANRDIASWRDGNAAANINGAPDSNGGGASALRGSGAPRNERNGNAEGDRAGANARGGRSDAQRQAERELERRRSRIAKRRADIEAEIEKKETERGALATEMNDPNFYLARKDADEMIARYESLGRAIDQLYAELVKFDETGSVA
jgi:ATP-binding cassette subfamily F protein 3